jgi:hypothetical protein
VGYFQGHTAGLQELEQELSEFILRLRIIHKYEFTDWPFFPHDSIVNALNQYIDLDVIPAIQSECRV